MTTRERDAQIYAKYLQHLTVSDDKLLINAMLAAEFKLAFSSIRRIIGAQKAQQRAEAWSPVTTFTLLPKPKSESEKDAARWKDAVRDLESRRYFTVVHFSDTHKPFQDADACELAYQVIKQLNPDLVVNLSDGFDFPQISHFAPDPDIGNEDILDAVRGPYWHENDRLDKVAPKAYRRAIMGNHDARLLAFLADTAPQVRGTVMGAFDELVRCRGRVIFPDHLQEIDVACLTVMHGNKSTLGMYGPKKQLEARKHQRFVMAGHSHSPGFYMTRGPERAVASVVGGYLSVFPHYIKDTTFNAWSQGFAYAVVDVKARHAWLQLATFERSEGLLKTVVGGRIFAQELSAAAEQPPVSAAA